MTGAVPSPAVGRPRSDSKLATPDDTTRVPARISTSLHDALRELCLIKLKRPIEVVIGEWVEERLPRELKAQGIAEPRPAGDKRR